MTTATPDYLETISRLWPLFIGFITIIIWFVRLEAKHIHLAEKFKDHKESSNKDTSDLEDDLKENMKQVWKRFNTVTDQNTEILRTLSRMEGKLETKE